MSTPAWGFASPTFTADQERTYAMMCHFSAIPSGFIIPLLLWVIGRGRSPFVDHQGKEALNFGINQTILYGVCIIALFAGFISPIVTIVAALGLVLVAVGGIVRAARGAMAAHRGGLHRYWGLIRFVR